MNHHRPLALACSVGLTTLCMTAQAEDLADGDAAIEETVLAEVIVTGEKIERNLQDTISSVMVFDAQTIDEQNFTDLFDLFNQTANVSTGFNDSVFTIRGVRNVGAGLGDSTSDVSTVYMDGVFLPSSLFTVGALNLWDVQSVEIFRGPQSTIQGRNALAGAIVMRTMDPSPDFEMSGQISYADFGSLRTSVASSLPIAGDQISLRISADHSSSDGYINNPTLGIDDASPSESNTFRGKLLIRPEAVPDLSVRLGYTHLDANEGEDRVEEALFPRERVTFENIKNRTNIEADIASLEFGYDFSENWSLTSVTGYTDAVNDNLIDASRDASGGLSAIAGEQSDSIFSQELRATFQSDSWTALMGAYYFTRDGDRTNGSAQQIGTDFAFPDPVTFASLLFQTPEPTAMQIAQAGGIRNQIVTLVPEFPVTFARESDTKIANWALFGEAEVSLTDQLSMTLGLRYDRETVAQNVFDSTVVPPIESGDPQINQILAGVANQFTNDFFINDIENDFDAVLPKVAFSYDWTDHLSTSISAQRGYRAGALSINLFRAALAPSGSVQNDLETLGIVNRFEPEYTNNYELAFRSQWLENKLTLNANLFYIDYTDQQVSVQISSNPLDRLTDNVGESELYGFEIETFAMPIRGLELSANVGYTKTEFTKGGQVLDDVIGGGVDLTGKAFSFAPEWTAGAGLRYMWDGGWFVNARGRYSDSSFAFPNNDETGINDSHVVLDLIAGYQADLWRLELFANNAFDEDYLSFNPSGPPGGAIAVAGPPRVIGARLVGGF